MRQTRRHVGEILDDSVNFIDIESQSDGAVKPFQS